MACIIAQIVSGVEGALPERIDYESADWFRDRLEIDIYGEK